MHVASVYGAGPGARAAASLNQGRKENKAILETVVGDVYVCAATYEVPGLPFLSGPVARTHPCLLGQAGM